MEGLLGASGLWHRAFLVCVSHQVWPVGAAGGPYWHGGKGACVRLFGRVVQMVGLFDMEVRTCACAFLACWSSRWAFLARRQGRVRMPFWPGGATGGPFWHGGKGVCVCLFGRVEQ